ncbi:MAG: phytanoyl-CoA dioxygenase family protein, partial [Acidimicrobiales bacterium]
IQYWPHTNYSPLTIGTYLYDCGPDQCPLGVLPGSHNGDLYDLYDPNGTWVGALRDDDAATLPAERSVFLPGPAGSVTVHNCRTLHHSARNDSPDGRPLLLYTFSAADAMPYTANPLLTSHAGETVRGHPARWARLDSRPCLMPPDWSGGYTSLFSLQQREKR